MIIDLTKPIPNSRFTRTVIVKPSSMDISEIFELNKVDVVTGDPITDENFDSDEVIYLADIGYTRRKTLMDLGYKYIRLNSSFYEEITTKNLVE